MIKAKKKLCISCQKRRDENMYKSNQSRICEICREVKIITRNKPVKLSKLKKDVQYKINKFIRDRDIENGCISCENGKVEEAGHFWSVGANSFIRYHPDNIHGQCGSCNRWKSGNLLEYRLALIKKIGIKRVEWLDIHHKDGHKFTREELSDILDKLDKGMIQQRD